MWNQNKRQEKGEQKEITTLDVNGSYDAAKKSKQNPVLE